MDNTKDRYITIQSVAETLSCTEQHIYALIREGALVSIKIGGRAVRISERSLQEFIAKNTVDPESFYFSFTVLYGVMIVIPCIY